MTQVLTLGTKEKRVRERFDKTYGIIAYDVDNLYPQRIEQTIARSSTAIACDALYATHLFGRGFKREDLNKLVVNELGHTVASLRKQLCQSFSMFDAAVIHRNYDGNMKPTEAYVIPFGHIRFAVPKGATDLNFKITQIKVYDNWDKSKGPIDVKKIRIIDLYVSDEELVKQAEAVGFENWNGAAVFLSGDGILEYPTAVCDAVLEDVETDQLIKVFKWRGTKKGYFSGGLFIAKGKPPENIQDKNTIIQNINENQGADQAHNITVIFAEKEEQIPTWIPFEIKNIDRQFELTEVSVRENIIRNYGQPLVLHAIKTQGGLGDAKKEWDEAKKNYDERTAEQRNAITEMLTPILLSLFPSSNIVPENDLIVVPVTGIEKQKDNRTLAEIIGVGGVQALTLVIQSTMTPQQKINFLVITFGIEANFATALVNGSTLPANV